MYDNFDIKKNPEYLTGEDIKEKYDIVFYGSDQIWRIGPIAKENLGFDVVYLGAYPINTKKRVSYAASMGIIDLNEKQRDFFGKLLQNFDSISVRETSLLKIVQELGYKAELTIDPVFLLEKEQWEKLIPSNFNKRRGRYILFYHHTPSVDAIRLVRQLSKKMRCKTIEINSKALPYAIGRRYKNTASPGEFLGLVRDAEFVVTTSFHGTVFSVLMQKQFFALGMGNNSGRSKTLLNLIGLGARYLDTYNCEQIQVQPIHYPSINNNLKKIINNSIGFLMRNLCDERT
jgi:polysaccharide pyruvyl transferase WcaK-like protein